ncbi:hypothetical protein NC969_22105 [Leptolyngbya subtilissima ST-M1]|uniref:hypothetical protein n=2 Tax=Cyanophyceae TaxID=3028117 RepID=UPI001682A0A0|nr:hypothetical protein [Nodosilinea sp. FACHB-131]
MGSGECLDFGVVVGDGVDFAKAIAVNYIVRHPDCSPTVVSHQGAIQKPEPSELGPGSNSALVAIARYGYRKD